MNSTGTSPYRAPDDAARSVAAGLIAQGRLATLGVLDPEDGFPLTSRIAVIEDGGTVMFLASDLSAHSKALAADDRASVLLGEPGKGDPLAHPRLTLVGRVARLPRDDRFHPVLREKWLQKHPRAELYIDFADFHFHRIKPERALLVAGFGKAYVLSADDLLPQ